MSADQDIFRAYGSYQTGLNKSQIQEKINHISALKKTYPFLRDVVFSDRLPSTIIREANKIGMFIPIAKRYGLHAYNFYINNIEYFETIFDRNNAPYPSHEEIIRTSDKYKLLSMYRDDEIFSNGKSVIFNYDDRKEMLSKYIDENYIFIGHFTIDSNSRSIYSYSLPLITYTEDNLKEHYSIGELIKLYDVNSRIILKKNGGAFNPLSLLQLRHIILEKICKWKDKSGYNVTYEKNNKIIPYTSHELKVLLDYIDSSIPHINKPNQNIYIDSPQTLEVRN